MTLWFVPMVNNTSIGYCEIQRIAPILASEPPDGTPCRYRYLLQADRAHPASLTGEVECPYARGNPWPLISTVMEAAIRDHPVELYSGTLHQPAGEAGVQGAPAAEHPPGHHPDAAG